MSKSVTDKNSVRRGYNPRWLCLFLVVAVLSGIVSTTTQIGDRSLKRTFERIEQSRLTWNSWRETEDSIRLELDQIGFDLATDSSIGASSDAGAQGLERIRRYVANLQIFRIPDLNPKESEPIYVSLAHLSLAADTLTAATSKLSQGGPGTVAAGADRLLRHAIRSQVAAVHALNSLRSARVQVVDRNNRRFNAEYDDWNSRDIINSNAALAMLVLLVALGVMIAIKHARSVRQSEERFRKIFDAAGFGMASLTLDGIITGSNHAFQEMLQYSGEELRGMNFAAITHPENLKVELALLASETKALAHGSIHYEKRCFRKAGEIIWARLSVIELKGEKAQPGYYIGMAEDITERKLAEEKIRESEMLYRTLFENSGEGLFLMTDKFIDCNQRAAEIWKCDRSEICGKSPADFSPEFQPDGRRSVDAAAGYIADAMDGVPKAFNWRHLRNDGVEIDTEVALKSLTVSGIKMIFATVRDVSERVRIEKELRESLIQLHTLVESAVDGIVIFGQDGSIESANPAAERIFGSTATSLAATTVIDLIAEPHRSQYQRLLLRPDSIHNSSLLRGVQEVLGLRHGGIVFPMDLAISPLKLGSDLKFVASVRDISERRLAEQQIIENEARLEAILSSAGDSIIVIDSDRMIQVANNAAQEIFGFAANELVGRRAGIIIPGIDEKPLPIEGERIVFDSMGFHCTRGEFPLQVSINRVSIGGTDSFAVIARDMAEEYRLRERLIEADKLTSIGTLAAGIAHEFKNCLAGIIGNASFGLDGLNEAEGIQGAREAFEQIIAIGEKADNIALSLLTYSRRREDDLELLDLRELIRSTLQFTGKELVDKGIRIVTDFTDVPKVMVSVNRAQQVFLNLIINASQAIPNSGVITITVRCVDTNVVVSIADTGVGISSENLRRIFDPFFSTKGVWGKDAVHGIGLGLTICRNIINSFGGEILVESTVGKGSTFTISLPIPPANYSSSSQVRSEGIKSLVLFSADAKIESAYYTASRNSGFNYRLARNDDYAEGSTSIDGETLVVIDCASPYLSQLVQLIDSCQTRSIRMAFINRAQSSKELLQFIDTESPTFEFVPEFSELISGAVGVRIQINDAEAASPSCPNP